MAKTNPTAPADGSKPNSRNNPIRREVARVACREVQSLAEMLRSHVEASGCPDVASAMRSGLLRLSHLSDIIYETAITDEPEESDGSMVASMGGYACLNAAKIGGAA